MDIYAELSIDRDAVPKLRRHGLSKVYTVTEVEPLQILVRTGLKGKGENVETEDFQVWTPYVVAITNNMSDRMNLSARPAPMTPDDEMLYALPWPHVSHYGWVCYYPDLKEANSLDDHAARAGYFLNTYFTTLYSYFISGHSSFPGNFSRAAESSLDQVRSVFREMERLTPEEICALEYTEVETLGERLLYEANVPRHLEGAVVIKRATDDVLV